MFPDFRQEGRTSTTGNSLGLCHISAVDGGSITAYGEPQPFAAEDGEPRGVVILVAACLSFEEHTPTIAGVLNVPESLVGAVLLRLCLWATPIVQSGGRVAVLVLPAQMSDAPDPETAVPTPDFVSQQNKYIADSYKSEAPRHACWVGRHARGVHPSDWLDGLHDSTVDALQALRDGQTDIEGLQLAMRFAHRDMTDGFRRQARWTQRLSTHAHEVARELGTSEAVCMATPWAPEEALVAAEDAASQARRNKRLHEELARLLKEKSTTRRQTAEYLTLCLAESSEPTPGGLARYRKTCPARGSRDLRAVYDLLRRRLRQ